MEKIQIQEAEKQLKRALLMMKYDTSKTLTENEEKILSEQTFTSVAKDTLKGAAAGAPFFLPYGAMVGAIIGFTSSFFGNPRSDTAKKLFDGCKSDKSTPTLDNATLRQIADDLNDAIEGLGTNEDKIKSSFSAIPTIPDLCGVIKQYQFHGDLWKDLMGDLENQGEWKDYVMAPLRPALDKSNEIKIEDNKCKEGEFYNDKTKKCEPVTKTSDPNKKTSTGTSKYKMCSAPPFNLYCKNDEYIKKVQGCLGIKDDGYLGPLTQQALKNVGVGLPLTQDGIDKVCSQSNTTQTKTQKNPYAGWEPNEPESGDTTGNKQDDDKAEG